MVPRRRLEAVGEVVVVDVHGAGAKLGKGPDAEERRVAGLELTPVGVAGAE